jgi:PPOX class probable F420-dependent enzyme
MTVQLPDLAQRLLDAPTCAVLTTINPDGAPQSSVVWVKLDGDEVVFSTILGRRKTLNMQRDPRVNICAYDPANPYTYVEVRGEVSMTESGGDELINELSLRYTGEAFTEAVPGVTRVVCRVAPRKVVTR